MASPRTTSSKRKPPQVTIRRCRTGPCCFGPDGPCDLPATTRIVCGRDHLVVCERHIFEAVEIAVDNGLPPARHSLPLDEMERVSRGEREEKPCPCHDFPLKVHHVTGSSPGEATVEVAAALRHAALQEGIAGFAAVLMENDGAVSIVAPNLPTSALAGLTRLRCEVAPELCDQLNPCGSCRVRLLVSAVMPKPIATD